MIDNDFQSINCHGKTATEQRGRTARETKEADQYIWRPADKGIGCRWVDGWGRSGEENEVSAGSGQPGEKSESIWWRTATKGPEEV